MLKNIYVRKSDESFWTRAEQIAAGQGVALSVWVTGLIRNHMYATGRKEVAEQTPAELVAEARGLLERVESMLVADS